MPKILVTIRCYIILQQSKISTSACHHIKHVMAILSSRESMEWPWPGHTGLWWHIIGTSRYFTIWHNAAGNIWAAGSGVMGSARAQDGEVLPNQNNGQLWRVGKARPCNVQLGLTFRLLMYRPDSKNLNSGTVSHYIHNEPIPVSNHI